MSTTESEARRRRRAEEIPEAAIVKQPAFAFLWRAPEAGIRWYDEAALLFPPPSARRRRDDDRGPGPWLVTATGSAFQYAPLDKRGLPHKFAALSSSDAIEDFACSYGLLGHSEIAVVGKRGKLRFAESKSRWLREIEAMREVLQQWDLVKRRSWDRKSAIDPARLRIYEKVNKKLRSHVDSVAHPYRGGQILHWPDCLLAALYLRLQLELAGSPARAVECKCGCGKLIENAGNSRRVFLTPSHGNIYRYRQRTERQRGRLDG